MNYTQWLHPQSPIREYLSWIQDGGNEPLFREKYADIVAHQQSVGQTFLTVVIRTQGNRNEMLQDVLLCLQSQKNQDFEVVLVAHKAEDENIQRLQDLIAAQDEEFAGRVRLISTQEGERGAPINLGFAYARGRYAVCLDDDDLVFDNWVESFHLAEQEYAGMILRSWAVTQDWECMVSKQDGRQRITASGSPDSKYCVPYHTLHEQGENMCPFMTLAFPLFLFRDMYILVDEELTTTEDWDYILRTVGIVGIHDTEEVTALYRLWNTQDASRNLMNEEVWRKNYKGIASSQRSNPILITSAEAYKYRDELTGLRSSGEKGRSCFFREALLFWKEGEEFADRNHCTAKVTIDEDRIEADFHLPDNLMAEQLRVDPAWETLFALKDIKLKILNHREEVITLGLEHMWESNGITDGNGILFLADRPMITFDAEVALQMDQVIFSAKVYYKSPESLNQMARAKNADERWMSENRKKAHLYLDSGEGFTEKECVEYAPCFVGKNYEVHFDMTALEGGPVSLIRIDPTEAGMVWLDQLRIRLEYADGRESSLTAKDISWSTGFLTEDGIAFLNPDPYFYLKPEERPVRCDITGQIRFPKISEMDMLFAEAKKVWDYRMIIEQLRQARKNQWMEGQEDDD